MSDPFDISKYPEDVHELVKEAQQRYQEAQAQAQRYEGLDAEPERVQQALKFLDQYTDPVHGANYRAEMARQWGILGEGQSLDDLKAIQQQIQDAQRGQVFNFDDPEDIDPNQFISALDQRYATPDVVNERIKQLEKQFAEQQEKQEMERDMAALDQQGRQLWRELANEDVDVTDREKEQILAVLKDRFQRNQVDGNNFHTAYRDAYEDWRTVVDERAKALMTAQQKKPRTTADPGATPGATTPVTDIASAAKALEEIFQGTE